ncbi:MAG: hypothetical protein M3319_00810 [Actinomycetota bacterium]|nr:hypothetical protein [Actinomycetota bacterium]
MELHALVKQSDEVGSSAMWVARVRYFAAVLHRCQRTSGLYRVKAASSRYAVPGNVAAYLAT